MPPLPVKSQVFEVGAQSMADRGLDQIGALARRLGDGITTIGKVGVIALATCQRIRAATTVQHVVATVTGRSTLADPLPVPLIPPLPVRVRFSG